MNDKCFVSQRSVNDCAVCCLTMILNMYDKDVTYESIYKQMKIDKEGSSLYEIIKLSKKYDLNATGYKSYELDEKANLPLIAHTINNELQHFVIVKKIEKNNITVIDPYIGTYVTTKSEFYKKYTKIAVIFKEDKFTYKKFFKNKFMMFLIFLIVIFFSLINVLYSYLLSYQIEHSISSLFILLVIFVILKELFDYFKNKLLIIYKVKTDRAITIPTLKRLLLLPYSEYQNIDSGNLISKINDLSYVKEMMFFISEVLFVNITIIIFCLVFISLVSIKLLFISLVIIFILIILNKKIYKKHLYKSYDLQIKNQMLTEDISVSLNGINTIKNLCKENYFTNKIINKYNNVIEDVKDLSSSYNKRNFFVKIINSIYILFTLYILLINKSENILFVIYLESIIIDSSFLLSSFYDVYSNYKNAYIRLKKLYEVKLENTSIDKIDIKNISFNNVIITSHNKSILKNINLSLNKGDFIFVKGMTGSGKTSLFKSIFNKTKGIKINDKSVKLYDNKLIRNSITYVDQSVKVFNMSIKDNIILDNNFNIKPKTYEIIKSILYKNGLNEDYILNNKLSNISGGEAKIIAIAQSLNINSSMIILDETTNQLDISLEYKLLKTIKEEYKDKIIVLISHRYDNEFLFDKVISVCDGSVKQNNTRRINDNIKQKRNEKNKSGRYIRMDGSRNNSRGNIHNRSIRWNSTSI